MFSNLILTGDTQVHSSLSNEGRNVRGRKEDKRDGQVFDEGNIETGLATELDITSCEQIQSSLLESTL